jgi:hypothetical protein
MKKLSATLFFLFTVSIALKSEANTKYLFDKYFSFVPFDRQVTENNKVSIDRRQINKPPTVAQVQKLKESDIQGVYLHLEYGYGMGVTIEYNPYLLLKDGSVYKNLDSSPTDLDVARSKQTEPTKWGTWKINSKTLSIQWNDGKSNSWDKNWFKAFAAKPGDNLNGTYQSLSAGGNTSVGGDVITVAFDNISFLPNGKFSQGKGAGASSSDTATSSQNSASGTYKLNNYTIEFNYEDGRVVRKMFYFYPEKDKKTDETIAIGNSNFVKDKP